MLASVIIPVFNGAATLERTLQGFLAQRMGAGLQFEVVLCDDSSTDASPGYRKHRNYLEAYGQPNIKLSNLMRRA